jgi:hypothetical protein
MLKSNEGPSLRILRPSLPKPRRGPQPTVFGGSQSTIGGPGMWDSWPVRSPTGPSAKRRTRFAMSSHLSVASAQKPVRRSAQSLPRS